MLKVAHEIVNTKYNMAHWTVFAFLLLFLAVYLFSGYLFWLFLYFSFFISPYPLLFLFFYFNMVQSIISYQDGFRNMEDDKTESSLFLLGDQLTRRLDHKFGDLKEFLNNHINEHWRRQDEIKLMHISWLLQEKSNFIAFTIKILIRHFLWNHSRI